MPALSESEFTSTMREPMVDVTGSPGEVVDVWSYVAEIAEEVELPELVVKKELVDQVYRSGNGIHDHVLLPTAEANKFVVIVVDRVRAKVTGHHVLDLNRKYRLG